LALHPYLLMMQQLRQMIFFCCFESEVASLLEVFAGVLENFVAISLEGVLNKLKQEKSVNLNVL
jgi:hypothetical protein